MTAKVAELRQYGALEVRGADARAFLHGQLTNDIEHLANDRARHAGWCSAKGRLLASLLVVPLDEGFLLQLARDLAPAAAKRLSMFVLRAKVKVEDATDRWVQFGLWSDDAPAGELGISRKENGICVRMGEYRTLVLAPVSGRPAWAALGQNIDESEWALEELRAGRPLITQATQDQFVPQMVNFERIGAVDFQKGCYPGQEIVARAQYRGQVKRRMVRARSSMPLRPGQDLFSDDHPGQPSGTVVNAVANEALAVVPITVIENGVAVRTAPDAAPLEVLPLPYAA